MIINYKKPNNNTVFGNYCIPSKADYFNSVQEAFWSLNMDYKSACWQLKMNEESIPLITTMGWVDSDPIWP